MASWRDQLQKASFRGVPFHVLSTDGEIGRRNAIHEYPLRDLPYAEDLGRKARGFSIEAFVLGEDYMSARDKLIDALEAFGAGELVHPYRGRSQVVVTSARISESTADGGVAQFSITFTESGEAVNPSPKMDTGTVVTGAADAAQAASESSFADLFSAAGLQDFVGAEALTSVNTALTSIRTAAGGMLGNALLPDFMLELDGISGNASSLINIPGNLAGGLFGLVRGLSGMASGPTSALSGLQSLFSFGQDLKPVPNSTLGGTYYTPSRAQQATNQAAVVNLTRQAAVIEAARVSTQIQPASYNEAIALRDDIAGQLETHAETAPDPVYRALTDLRIAVIQDINTRAADLSRTVQYPVPRTLPALVVAHRLYGNVSQADSIVARNRIRHPGFVPGGRAIEVLTA